MIPVRHLKGTLCLVLIAFLFVASRAFAQMPSPTPVSPEAAALAKMVNYSVSLNTGVPQIGLPLYQAKGGGMTLPVDLSYHAGGFKVNEHATSVGLGWSLDCELQITRTINGRDDFERYFGYLANTNMMPYYKDKNACPGCEYPLSPTAGSWRNVYGIATGAWDGMPDKFNYNLLGKSGSFYFVKNNSGIGYSIVSVPLDNIKISYNDNLFTIVDSDGTTYYFGSEGAVGQGDRAARGLEESGTVMRDVNGERCQDCKITTWKCKKITNATKTDEITFDYETKKTVDYPGGSNRLELYTSLTGCSGSSSGPVRAKDINSTITTYRQIEQQYPFYVLSSPKYFVSFRDQREFHLPDVSSSGGILSEKVFSNGEYVGPGTGSSVRPLALKHIKFPGGDINFDYDADEALKKITVSAENLEVKSFAFFQSYATTELRPELRTRYLDSIQMKSNNDVFERYLLAYNSKTYFGDRLIGQDAWGYKNAQTREEPLFAPANRNAVPAQKIKTRFYFSYGQGCLDYIDKQFLIGTGDTLAELPHENTVTQRGMLHRIVYPTGGYVDFDYESNVYQETAQARDGSGSYPIRRHGGGVRIKSISYYDRPATSPNTPVRQKSYTYGQYENGVGLLINKPARKYNDGRQDYDGYHFEQTVGYVTGPNDIPGNGSSFPPIPIDCNNKSCLGVSAAETKTTFLPASGVDYTYSNGAPIYYTHVTEYETDQGKFTGKKVYTYYPPETFVNTVEAYSTTSMIPDTDVPYLQADGLIGHLKSIQDFQFDDQRYLLVHSKEYTYNKYVAGLQPRVVYSFLNTTYQIIGGTYSGNIESLYDPTVNFRGSIYGPAVASYNSGQYGIEVSKVYLSQEVEKWVKYGQEVSKTTKYSYDFLPYLNPSAVEVEDSKGEKTKMYYTYSYNLTGTPVYSQMLAANIVQPVIETRVVNTSRNQELSKTRTNYQLITEGTSFFAPVSIEKSINGSALQLETSITKYNQKANVLETTSRDGLIKSYLWGYQYQYAVAEFTNVPYATLATKIDVNTLPSITEPMMLRSMLGSLQQDVRPGIGRYFTYKPQVGVLSETDYNGQQTSYEYDPYGRLLRIKDASGAIIKKFTYNGNILYKFTVPSTLAFNTPQMGSFSKLCADGRYTAYNHIIPGGTRTAIDVQYANKFALNDLFGTSAAPGTGWGAGAEVPCDTDPTSLITLKAFMFSLQPMPEDVYIDFYGDNGVYGTQRFPYYQGAGSDVKFYFARGNWIVSLRPTIEYRGRILKYWVNVSDGTNFYIKSGDTLQIRPNLNYEITVSNAL